MLYNSAKVTWSPASWGTSNIRRFFPLRIYSKIQTPVLKKRCYRRSKSDRDNYLTSQLLIQMLGFPLLVGLIIRLPRRLNSKDSTCQCRRHKTHKFGPCVGKTPWRREWQSAPGFLPGNPKVRGAWRARVHGWQRVGHDCVTERTDTVFIIKTWKGRHVFHTDNMPTSPHIFN